MAGLCFLIDDQVVVVWHTTLDDNTLDTFTIVVLLCGRVLWWYREPAPNPSQVRRRL